MKNSEKRLAANRANATRSTGPRSAEGKSRSAQNARKHGFTASSFSILRIEEVDELSTLRAEAIHVYGPVNSEELFAVERIALCKLSIFRAARLEAGMFTDILNRSLNDNNIQPWVPLDPALEADPVIRREQIRAYALANGFNRMAAGGNCFALFLRYQTQAERQFRRAVEEFERLKKQRGDLPNEPISELDPPAEPPSSEPPTPCDADTGEQSSTLPSSGSCGDSSVSTDRKAPDKRYNDADNEPTPPLKARAAGSAASV